MPSSTLDRPRTRANPASRAKPANSKEWVVLVPGQQLDDASDAAIPVASVATSPAIRRPAPAFAPPTYRPTGLPPIVRAVGSRLLLLVGFLGAIVAMLGLITGQDPLLTFGFKTPQFVAYQGASPENVRYILNDGWTRTATVPGGILMDWQSGSAEPAVLLTLGNPAAEPEIERLGADGQRIEEIRYRGSWPGVDTVLKAMPGGFSSNMIVEPGVNPGVIEMEYVGATALSIDAAGRLRIQTPSGVWIDGTPESWQDGPSGREPVDSHFELRGGNRFGFTVGPYDPSRPLVVDPPSERER